MKIESEKLLQDLIESTRLNINQSEQFKQLTTTTLNWRAAENSWSILECFQHLNLYGEFYIPEIDNKINKSTTSAAKIFKAGILGNYFAVSMLPKEQLNKMKTFKSKNPIGSTLDKTTIELFIEQQIQMLQLLSKASKINLNKVKTGVTISKWIKLKLGDTFRVVIYHNERHIVQAQKILKQNKESDLSY